MRYTETTLEAEDINLLTAVLKVCRNGPIADRNALVHSIWGFFDDIPDGLLLWDASTRAQSHIDDLNHFAKENNKGTLIPRPDTRDIRIATLEELQKGIERARQSLTNMALLSFFISPDFGARNDPEMLAKLRAELSKRPEIQEVLARLTPNQKTPPSEPQ